VGWQWKREAEGQVARGGWGLLVDLVLGGHMTSLRQVGVALGRRMGTTLSKVYTVGVWTRVCASSGR
jgi:hypothetical protein